MVTDTIFKQFSISENNTSIGKIQVNQELVKSEDFIRPFIRDVEAKEVLKIGNRDYNALDNYIIASLKDYYNRLMKASVEERDSMLNVYHHLYNMWQDLHNCKLSRNFKEMDKMYDLFSYELYVLGYIN